MAALGTAWTLACHTGEIPEGQVKQVTVGDLRLAVCHLDGNFFAIEDVCTHDNGPLNQGCLEGEEIECPRHGARFNVRTGEATLMPAVMPVRTFAVQLDGDTIYVHVA